MRAGASSLKSLFINPAIWPITAAPPHTTPPWPSAAGASSWLSMSANASASDVVRKQREANDVHVQGVSCKDCVRREVAAYRRGR